MNFCGMRPDTLPYSTYYYGLPLPYLVPQQSTYHNLGLNAFTPKGAPYMGKNKGMLGDYGPRQINSSQIPAIYPYPLDADWRY